MKIGILILCIAAFALYACNGNKTPGSAGTAVSDTLSYKMIDLKKRAPDCGSKADSDCTVAKFNYPIFAGHKALNDSVTNNLLHLFQLDEKPDTSLTVLVDKFVANYMSQKKEMTDGMFYTLDCYAKVLRQDAEVAVVETWGDVFQGGAHPVEYTGYINWNTKSDKIIALDDLVDSANIQKFTKVAESIFRKEEKLADTASLNEKYFFTDGKFALANTFYLQPKGIMFFYNQYEIKSYAEGTTELFVPYDKIKSLLRPNTVVAQYIK